MYECLGWFEYKMECKNMVNLTDKLKNSNAYYGIRIESIGGLGANLCGKMLGELGVRYLDLNSSSFSSYGSEKTGTPVKAFIRYADKDKEIRDHSPVTKPDLLMVFHQALLNDSSILDDCDGNTKVIVAVERDFKMPALNCGICYGINAQKIANETHSRINVVMLGAALKVMGLENVWAGEKICTDTLGQKYPDSLNGNLEGLRRGFEEVFIFEMSENSKIYKQGKTHELGYLYAPMGGINPWIGNSVVSDLSPSRQGFIPVFIKEKCINCGLCFSTCPDMVFQFKKGNYNGREMMTNEGLNYYHCKGCLRCVDICPVNALVRGEESENPDKKYFMPNQELLRMPEYYEKTGADGYITSESFLTEKRMDGGEV